MLLIKTHICIIDDHNSRYCHLIGTAVIMIRNSKILENLGYSVFFGDLIVDLCLSTSLDR